MHGEGDAVRHMASMGYRLTHTQSPLHEYDFSVASLAADLRNGLRLCKLLDLLAGGAFASVPAISFCKLFLIPLSHGLLPVWQCRAHLAVCNAGTDAVVERAHFPADRRPQQLQNVSLALDTMQAAGLGLQVRQKVAGFTFCSVTSHIVPLVCLSLTMHNIPRFAWCRAPRGQRPCALMTLSTGTGSPRWPCCGALQHTSRCPPSIHPPYMILHDTPASAHPSSSSGQRAPLALMFQL